MLHTSKQPAPTADELSSPCSEVDWSPDEEPENSGFNALIEEINRNKTHDYLLESSAQNGTEHTWPPVPISLRRDIVLHTVDHVPVAPKRNRTEKGDNVLDATKHSKHDDTRPASAAVQRNNANTQDGLQTLSFLVLFSEYERQFLTRAKAALRTDDLPYSVKEEHATNAFLAARLVMALQCAGTPRSCDAELHADMTPDEREQATADALTQEDRDLADIVSRNYFDSLLPGRLLLAARLAFS
jgi:hypothetical protein